MSQHLHHLLSFVADFGDLAVVVPAFAAVAIALVANGRGRDALIWVGAFLACASITLLLKSTVGGFKTTLFSHTLRAASFPSGHAAMSLVFYGGLAGMLWYGSRAHLARLVAVALLLLETAIIAAVFLLAWHPLFDLVCGVALGGAFIALLWATILQERRRGSELAGIMLGAALLVGLMHGVRLDDQHFSQLILATARAHQT
jgi:membrane-associated phospholipid phosphatase